MGCHTACSRTAHIARLLMRRHALGRLHIAAVRTGGSLLLGKGRTLLLGAPQREVDQLVQVAEASHRRSAEQKVHLPRQYLPSDYNVLSSPLHCSIPTLVVLARASHSAMFLCVTQAAAQERHDTPVRLSPPVDAKLRSLFSGHIVSQADFDSHSIRCP